MPHPIIISARFRTGSTLLWNIYRQVPEVMAFYEPLHEELPEFIQSKIKPQKKHFNVSSYFDEYPSLQDLRKHHQASFGVSRLYLEENDRYPEMADYLSYIISLAGESRVPVLKENRIDFRLPWVRKHFPEASLLHLYRSPRDEWISAMSDEYQSMDIPLEEDPYLMTTWARDLTQQFPFLASPYLRHIYQRFYYLWRLSYLAGSRLADYSLAYEDLLKEPARVIPHLLNLAGLDVAANLARCSAIITPRPKDTWQGFASPDWFADMEGECEARLAQLGLSGSFGLKPLGEIISSSPTYLELVADPTARQWAITSGQTALVHWKNIARERDLVARERLDTIKNLHEALSDRDQMMNHINSTLVLVLYNRFNLAIRPMWQRVPWLRRILNFLMGRYDPIIPRFKQYPPRPMRIPKAYFRKSRPHPALPLISIVTPSYNQGPYLERTIQSVINQGYPRLEYIIQDAVSTDETPVILEKYRDRLFSVEFVKDSGQANGLNRGFRRTSGEIMAYLNSDDLLLPGALYYVGRYFQRHPQVDVVYGHRIVIDTEDQEIGRWVLAPHNGKLMTWVDYIPQETLFWRRRIWDKVGGAIDETFRFAMDWDLLNRFQEAGARFQRLPRLLGGFRVHEEQKTIKWSEIGQQEIERIRFRYRQRPVTLQEINQYSYPYRRRSVVYHRLADLGIFL